MSSTNFVISSTILVISCLIMYIEGDDTTASSLPGIFGLDSIESSISEETLSTPVAVPAFIPPAPPFPASLTMKTIIPPATPFPASLVALAMIPVAPPFPPSLAHPVKPPVFTWLKGHSKKSSSSTKTSLTASKATDEADDVLDLGSLFKDDDSNASSEIVDKSDVAPPDAATEKAKLKKKLEYYRNVHLARIQAGIEPWIPLSYNIIVLEHVIRAQAFLTCCGPVDENKLKTYVDNYGLFEQQEKLIQECASNLPDTTTASCHQDIHKMNDTKEEIVRIAEQDPTQPLLKTIESAIKVKIYPDNIVHDYGLSTSPDGCLPALLLIWKPNMLLDCETKHRSKMVQELTSLDNYDKFNEKISKPFQELVYNLFINLKIVTDQVNKITAPLKMSVSKARVDTDISEIKAQIIDYKILNQDPMILHYEKRAHAYKVCCAQMETDDLFDEYLLNFNQNLVKMDKLLRGCLHKQGASVITADTLYGGDCQVAYNELTEAMGERQDFINKYEGDPSDLIESYQKAITPKLSRASVIKSMKNIVNQYCPERHVFELMFDPVKVITCEELARLAIRQNTSDVYTYYHLNISKPFLRMIKKDWQQLEIARSNSQPILAAVVIDGDTTVSNQQASVVQPQPPPFHQMLHPHRSHQIPSKANNLASWIITPTHRIFNLFFLIIIHRVFF